ncbi:MAG: hypothetical protein CTY23_09820 [Methylomonas sp.]|nr:MAG: hypothetical protein CTY23_09820 [Methylomonas sp.]
MDARSLKTFELYLAGPCHGAAVVVVEDEAEIDLLDADFPTAGELLQSRWTAAPGRPIVLLSLQPLAIANTTYLAKPVNAEALMNTLNGLRPAPQTASPADTAPAPKTTATSEKHSGLVDEATPQGDAAVQTPSPPRPRRHPIESNEGGFTALLGVTGDIDFDDPKQIIAARFDPNLYFLSYAHEAFKRASEYGQAMQLHSAWKPVLIFPGSRQVWLDADDKQTRVFAGMEQKKNLAGAISLTPVDAAAVRATKAPDKFQDMDAFLWKLAIWTSKGRLPMTLNAQQPVYIRHWPNFTRLMMTPDALRVVALLAQGPRSPLEVAQSLNIRANYVFVVITACWSLGLLDQRTRSADYLVTPEPPKPDKKQDLLTKILNRLRGDAGKGGYA